jgi:L-lactate dehydrogenase complex protein LldG
VEREAFLARVRAAAVDAAIPATPGAQGPLVWSPPRSDLVAQFETNLAAVDGVAHRVARSEVAATLAGIAADCGVTRCLSWDEEWLVAPGVRAALEAAGVELVDPVVPADPGGRLAHQQSYDDVGIGVTGALAGLAESGSVILESGPGRSRMASLIPPVHVAILDANRMYASLSHFAAAHPGAARAVANLVIVTGPSRTGDIEVELNLGVHGPGELHVVLAED